MSQPSPCRSLSNVGKQPACPPVRPVIDTNRSGAGRRTQCFDRQPSQQRHPVDVRHRHPPGHNGMVKPRIRTVAAFGVGYVLGSRAGRERYRQIVRAASSITQSAPFTGTVGIATDRARALAVLGVERVRDAVGVRLGWRNGDDAAVAIATSVAKDVATALNGQLKVNRPPITSSGARPNPS